MAEQEKKLKVLVVEDENALLETYADLLRDIGFDVLTAIDGYKALDILEAEGKSIDLIYLDLMMAGIDGLEVLRRIKKKPDTYGNSKVIVLTNMTSERVIKEAFTIGADSYLIKSELDAEDLSKEAKNVLED